MHGRGGSRCLLVAVILAAGAVACGDDGGDVTGGEQDPDGSAEEAVAAARPYAVETFSETLVDDSRPADDPQGDRGASTRTLETDIYVPEGEGPFPLIVHAHGFEGHAGKYTELLTTWAEAGFVVAAPTFPLTNDVGGARGTYADYVNQPADVSFVIDQVLAMAGGDHPELAGLVDEEAIGLSGHSLGGITAYGLLFNSCCSGDDRIDALAVLGSLPIAFEGGSYTFEGGPPLLLTLTTGDPIITYDEATPAYDRASSPKFLVTLDGEEHYEPYEDAASPHDEVVAETTSAFWDAYLLDDPDAVDRLIGAAEADDLTTLTSEV